MARRVPVAKTHFLPELKQQGYRGKRVRQGKQQHETQADSLKKRRKRVHNQTLSVREIRNANAPALGFCQAQDGDRVARPHGGECRM